MLMYDLIDLQDLDYELRRQGINDGGSSYVGQRLAKCLSEQTDVCVNLESPQKLNGTFLDIQVILLIQVCMKQNLAFLLK